MYRGVSRAQKILRSAGGESFLMSATHLPTDCSVNIGELSRKMYRRKSSSSKAATRREFSCKSLLIRPRTRRAWT
jgi:hypothetical protein